LVFKALHGLASNIWLIMMTANSSLPLTAVNYNDRQTPSGASFNSSAFVLAIDHSQSLDHVYETVYPLNFVIQTFPSDFFVQR